MDRIKWLLIFCITNCAQLAAQADVLGTEIAINDAERITTPKSMIIYISNYYNVSISYNASQLRDDVSVTLSKTSFTLRELLIELFPSYQLSYIISSSKKVILTGILMPIERKSYNLRGVISDANTGETISGAVLSIRGSKSFAISDENGYFITKVTQGEYEISVSYLGYDLYKATIDLNSDLKQSILLKNDTELPTVVISSPQDRVDLHQGGEIVDVYKTREFKSIIGEKDLINNARILPGVQSGGEGQSGLYVRGGTSDQNLILLDGIPMYETSHTAGISSIFIEETIKEANFMKNGFQARYAGRLSSVMNIQLKDGDKKAHQSVVSVGIPGAKLHFSGPIKTDKTTYNIAARTSWLNFYLNRFLVKYTKYDDIKLNYSDLIGKIAHNFSSTNQLSFTFYNGSDRLSLLKNSDIPLEDGNLSIFDRNALNWGNQLASLKWNILLNDRLGINVQVGALRYSNGARSTYDFRTVSADSTRRDQLDVLSYSSIEDKIIKAEGQYYYSDKHVFRLGTTVTQHNFNPTVKQSLIILDGDPESIIDRDSSYNSTEYGFFAEDNIKFNNKLFLYVGFHQAFFNTGKKTYGSFQPRLNFIYSPHKDHLITVAGTRMAQFIHLLSNSGLGLPSDLWVPSTDNIKPQVSDQYSLTYAWNPLPTIHISLGGYTKRFYNTLEYTSPVELFYFLINNQSISTIYNNARDWERNVLTGSGSSRGLEFLLHKREGNLRGWLSATYSKTQRQFEQVNNNRPFAAAHDRTIDFNSGLMMKFSEAFSMGLNFIYATGNAFSLATEEYDSFLGIKLLNTSGRNNYRLPAYHQLGLNANYVIKKQDTEVTIDFNIYNVYNRKNAYFIYIYKNPLPPYDNYLRKVSILPISPSLNISLKF